MHAGWDALATVKLLLWNNFPEAVEILLESFSETDSAMLACLEIVTVTLFCFVFSCENTEPELCLTESQPIILGLLNM